MKSFEQFLNEAYSSDFYKENKSKVGTPVLFSGKINESSINLDGLGEFIAYLSNNKSAVVIEETDSGDSLNINLYVFKQIIKSKNLDGEISDKFTINKQGNSIVLTNTDEGDTFTLPLECFNALRKFGKNLM